MILSNHWLVCCYPRLKTRAERAFHRGGAGAPAHAFYRKEPAFNFFTASSPLPPMEETAGSLTSLHREGEGTKQSQCSTVFDDSTLDTLSGIKFNGVFQPLTIGQPHHGFFDSVNRITVLDEILNLDESLL